MKKLFTILCSWSVVLSVLMAACASPAGEAAPAAEAKAPAGEATALMAEAPVTAEQLSGYSAQEYAYVALLGTLNADAKVVKAEFVQAARYEGLLLLRNKSSLRHASAVSAQIPEAAEIFVDERGAYLIYGTVSIWGLQSLPIIVTLSPDRNITVAIDSDGDQVADLLMGGVKNLATAQLKTWIMANAAGDLLWSCLSMTDRFGLTRAAPCGSSSTTSSQPGGGGGFIHTLSLKPALLSPANCTKIPSDNMNPPTQPVAEEQAANTTEAEDTTEVEDTQTIHEMVEEMVQTLQDAMEEMSRTLDPSTIKVEPAFTNEWTEPTMPPDFWQQLLQDPVIQELKKFDVELHFRDGKLVGGKLGYTFEFSPPADPYGNPENSFEDPRCYGQEITKEWGTLFMDRNFCKGADMLECIQRVSDPISVATGGQCRIEPGPADEQKLVCDSVQQFWTQVPPSDNDCSAPADGPCRMEKGEKIDQAYVSLTPLSGVLAVKCWADGCPGH